MVNGFKSFRGLGIHGFGFRKLVVKASGFQVRDIRVRTGGAIGGLLRIEESHL